MKETLSDSALTTLAIPDLATGTQTGASSVTPHVSVIIPCHNRVDTVEEAVRSVLDQDYPAFDVIAVDDASSDGTLSVLGRIDDSRLRILENPGPNGPSGARNHGVAATAASWIAFHDSDDIWLPGRLSGQMAELAGSAHVAGYCGMVVKADAQPDTPMQKGYPDRALPHLSGEILSGLTMGSFISTQMLVMRRDVFVAVGGFDADLNALVDWELMLRVAQKGSVAFLDADLVVQRMSDNSITRSTRKRLQAQDYVLNKHRALFARYPKALARHHHRIAGGFKDFGEFPAAARHAGAAWRTAPLSLRYGLNTLYLHGRRLLG